MVTVSACKWTREKTTLWGGGFLNGGGPHGDMNSQNPQQQGTSHTSFLTRDVSGHHHISKRKEYDRTVGFWDYAPTEGSGHQTRVQGSVEPWRAVGHLDTEKMNPPQALSKPGSGHRLLLDSDVCQRQQTRGVMHDRLRAGPGFGKGASLPI